jgi:ubiquinone/menaquinone biosynthesis C-methylase UbiE
MAGEANVGLWEQMIPEDAERFGHDMFDLAARKRWCQAIMFGGLPHLWRHVALVPRQIAIEKLELRSGDRVLIVGEAVEDIGFDNEIRELVGSPGEVITVDIRSRVFEEFHAGREPKWQWDFTREYPDQYFDCVFVGQGVAHAADWGREGQELLRVMHIGRRLVLAEISFSQTFYARLHTDVHLEYWVRKLMEGLGDSLEELPYWNLADVERTLSGHLDDIETFEWRGVDLLWGRKPGAIDEANPSPNSRAKPNALQPGVDPTERPAQLRNRDQSPPCEMVGVRARSPGEHPVISPGARNPSLVLERVKQTSPPAHCPPPPP